jgi:ligand-binding sensor domain-containing protein/AAA+ ATPase superfamily predicted ATPase
MKSGRDSSITQYAIILRQGKAERGGIAGFSGWIGWLWLGLILALPGGQFAAQSPPPGPAISGVVVGESGTPLADVKVVCTGPTAPSTSLLTAGDGRFTFPLPRVGKYTIVATASGYRPQTQTITLNRLDETPADIKLQLSPSSLRVLVRDERAGTPMAGAVVTARLRESSRREASALRALESRRGEYFFGRMEAGVYEVTAVVTGYEAKTSEVVVTGERTTLEVTLLLNRVSTIPLGIRSLDRSFVVPRLPSNDVQTVFPDRDGSVWFGTAAGVCRFDGQQFWSSEAPESPLSPLAGKSVTALARTADGTLWFGLPTGLAALRPTSTTVMALSEPAVAVTCLLPGPSEDLWVGTGQGLYRYWPSPPRWDFIREIGNTRIRALLAVSGGLVVATDRGLFRWPSGPGWEPVLPAAQVGELAAYGLAADPQSLTVWCTTAAGLYTLTPDGQLLPVSGSMLQRPLGACHVDSEGHVWCARADGPGVVVYDPRRQETAEVLTDTEVTAVAGDPDQNVWLATRKGALRYDAYSFVVFDTSRGLPDSDVQAMAPRAEGGLWVGTSRGVYAFDGIRFQRVHPELDKIPVRALLAVENRLWVGAENGLWLWDGNTVQSIPAGEGAFSRVRSLLFDGSRQTLWVATAKALFKVDSQTLKLDSEAIPLDGEVRMALLSRSGTVWLATNDGVYRYEPGTAELVVIGTTLGLESLDVRTIVEQPQSGRFWLATGRGIETFDGVSFISDEFRAAVQGGDVQTLYVEQHPSGGFLWVGLGDGSLRKFLLDGNGVAQTYRRDRYDLGGLRFRAMVATPDGHLWLATDAGLVRHRPNVRAPVIDIRLEADGAELPGTAEASLRAGFHRLKFRFTALSQTGPVTYFYRLSGRDAKWRILSPERTAMTTAEYAVAGLPAGEHIFEVRALNRDLYGQQAPVQRYVVRIDAPFYLRGWFWALCVLVMTGGGTGVWFVQRARSREYVLPPALRQFTPIQPNPYVVGNPIRSQAMFFGREDDFHYVARKLEGTPQGLVIVFCGERRTGKSSILYQMANGRLGTAFVPVFIDLQEMLVQGDREFFSRVARLVVEAVAKATATPVSLAADPLFTWAEGMEVAATARDSQASGGNVYDQVREFIGRALQQIGNRQMVWLVDEYELFETKIEEDKLSRDLLPFLASLLDRYERLSFVFTGSRRLEERDKRLWRDLLRRSLFRKVSYLTPNDTRRLITEPVRDRVVYGRGVVEAIVRLTAGQPFYTQVICQNIVDFLNEQERHYVLRADVLTIVEEVVNNPLPQMIYFWEALSDDEKLVLALVADTLVDEQDVVSSTRLAARITECSYPMTLSEATIRLTLEELFRRELLEKYGADAFAYRVDLLRHWIRRSHSVWQVVGEVRSR